LETPCRSNPTGNDCSFRLDTKVIGKGQTQMIALIERGKRCSTPIAIASMFLVLVYGGGARAAIVTNGDFKVPVVANAQGPNPLDGYLTGGTDAALTGSGVGWSFAPPPGGCAQGNGHAGESGITEQQVASGFAAPAAPVGTQMGWIINLGKIEQQINLTPGNYKLSFEIARRAVGISGGAQTPTPLPIEVRIGAQTFGPFTPASAASFNKVEVPFTILEGGLTSLRFSGTGLPFCPNVENNTTFIAEVSISAEPGPVITSGSTDIFPFSPVVLEGVHFGVPTGQIKIVFPSPSETPFSNGSKSELHLDAVGATGGTAAESLFGMVNFYPQGSPKEQTVDITISSADGKQTSNVWHAKFHNTAWITSGPTRITPGQSFLLKGWDFDSTEQCNSEKTGTVTVNFPNKDLVLAIPKDGCLPDSIKVKLPADVAGFVAQTVEVIYQSPGGRKAGWNAQFVPKQEFVELSQAEVTATCSNQSAFDICNGPVTTASGCPFVSPDPDANNTSYPTIEAYHDGCFGLSSDNGTDLYLAIVQNGWMITYYAFSPNPEADNGSIACNLTSAVTGSNAPPASTVGPDFPFVDEEGVAWENLKPAPSVFVTCPWHIGATGGEIFYEAILIAQGPVGVPYH
jgi:hypothetical protein